MKNLTYLFVLLLSMTLMSFSCQKEDTITPETPSVDLTGAKWMFVSLNYNGTVYTPENVCGMEKDQFGHIDMDFINATTVTLYDNCFSVAYDYSYTIKDGYLTISTDNTSGLYKFQILPASDVENGVLELKHTSSMSNSPVGGTYRFQR